MGGDKDAWDICEPWCRTYLANASAGEKAEVVIISTAVSQWEDVNVWETNQFLVPSLLLMWFWKFISRSISVTCSLVSETSAQSTWTLVLIQTSSTLICLYIATGRYTVQHGSYILFIARMFPYSSAAGWCKALGVLLKVYVSTKRCWY